MECEGQTDEIIAADAVHNREAFGCIVKRYKAPIRRYVRRIMPGIGDDEDDVLQDIFVKTYVNIQGFDAGLKFSSWLYRIAHNEAVSWLRKKKARPEPVDLGESDVHTFAESIDVAHTDREQGLVKDEVARTLSLLPEKYRTVLVLKFLEGKSYDEISDILAVPIGTVGTLMHRAKKSFTSFYTQHYE